MFYSGDEGLRNLLAAIHLVDSGLIDDWLGGGSVRSTKDLGLSKYVILSMRQPLVTTDSLLAV